MNSPYMGEFRVSQEFKGAAVHDGLDLVGVDSKEVHCVVSGTVIFCGWENPQNHGQGFGKYVKVQAANGDIWYYGHLSDIRVKAGQEVRVTDVLGTEGSTGHSTGSHLHICCRPNGIKAKAKDVSELLRIPNEKGTYDDGYLAKLTEAGESVHTVKKRESLWKIAAKYLGDGTRYPEIMKLNDLSSDKIYAGMTLRIPEK
ncbi:MAG: peptidoglycan DD-metalloendopeptidase family protein [Ruminococcus sp.]|nr:peptidoglycan DD-metalloendopeptidase family protein [Ruminococcus sp.]